MKVHSSLSSDVQASLLESIGSSPVIADLAERTMPKAFLTRFNEACEQHAALREKLEDLDRELCEKMPAKIKEAFEHSECICIYPGHVDANDGFVWMSGTDHKEIPFGMFFPAIGISPLQLKAIFGGDGYSYKHLKWFGYELRPYKKLSKLLEKPLRVWDREEYHLFDVFPEKRSRRNPRLKGN